MHRLQNRNDGWWWWWWLLWPSSYLWATEMPQCVYWVNLTMHRLHKAEWQCASGGESRCYSRMSAAGDADGFVINLQADGAGELALQTLSMLQLGLGMRLSELSSRNKTAEHRHHEHWMPPLSCFFKMSFFFFCFLCCVYHQCAVDRNTTSVWFKPRKTQIKRRYIAHLSSQHIKHTLTRRLSKEVNITSGALTKPLRASFQVNCCMGVVVLSRSTFAAWRPSITTLPIMLCNSVFLNNRPARFLGKLIVAY